RAPAPRHPLPRPPRGPPPPRPPPPPPPRRPPPLQVGGSPHLPRDPLHRGARARHPALDGRRRAPLAPLQVQPGPPVVGPRRSPGGRRARGGMVRRRAPHPQSAPCPAAARR